MFVVLMESIEEIFIEIEAIVTIPHRSYDEYVLIAVPVPKITPPRVLRWLNDTLN